MKKLAYLGFGLMLAAGFGCAVTDYDVITDNNQRVAGRTNDGRPVNTAGKAHRKDKSQIVTIWPDGTDELFSFVDQKSDGTATITTYNNFSTGSEPTFHDDMYCNASWSGCAIFTAPDDNDGNRFDGFWNTNCTGARGLSLLLSTVRYEGECGTAASRLSVADKVSLLDSAAEASAFGRSGLLWNLDAGDTSISVRNDDNGLTVNVPFYGANIDHFLSNGSKLAFTWLDHAMLGMGLRDFANKLDNELNGESLKVTITHNGISTSFTIAGGAAGFDVAGAMRHRANVSF